MMMLLLSQMLDINAIETCQTQLKTLKTWNFILIIALVMMCIVVAVILFLNQKTRKERIQAKKDIEENQQANLEISQMLSDKMQETEQKDRELSETKIDLEWQTENALRLFDEVETQKREITDSIEYAKKIQSVLLPEESFINEILNDYFVLFKPRDIVSGDFYWVTAKANKTIVVAADCTGHGVPGAFMSLLGITFLNSIVQNEENPQADVILNMMRESIIKSLKQKGKELENRDGMDMAISIIDWENERIEYAGANISLLLLRSTSKSPHELIEYRADRMPIGLFGYEELVPFTRHFIPIIPGDSFYMFSDGYCDQFGGDDLKKFKKKNLTKMLSEIHTLSMAEQKKIIEKTMDEWKGDLSQVDDMLMIGIKI